MTTATSHSLPLLLEPVRVERVVRLSPSFVRLELGSPALADLGVDGPFWDQRVKLVLPHGDGPLPSCDGADESWFTTWAERPVEQRGHMRTYTVRRVLGEGAATRLVVDVVLHGAGEDHGEPGPGSTWAARAAVGDEVILLAPRRGLPYGGIEWAPGEARQLLLVGDETALPAVAAILEQLDPSATGAAFVEVPVAADRQDLVKPDGVSVTWVVRHGAAHGERLHAAVVAHLGGGSLTPAVSDDEVDPDLWETPVWSSSGEAIDEAVTHVGHDLDGLYAWIAGEAKVVTGLRRVLVAELGVDRRQVAFMGYWRLGVAMRS